MHSWSAADRGIYRLSVNSPDLTAVHVSAGESDLYISALHPDRRAARVILRAGRSQISSYLSLYPAFGRSLLPRLAEEGAPVLVENMARAARRCGLGPMAAVAGVLADAVGEALRPSSASVIVENGGDIYLASDRDRIVALYAGEGNKFTGRLAVKIRTAGTPLGIAASSRKIGPSLNWGSTDLTVVLADTCVLADAAATALSNRIYRREIPLWERAIEWIKRVEGVRGGLIIMGDRMQAWGEMELAAVSIPRSDRAGKDSVR